MASNLFSPAPGGGTLRGVGGVALSVREWSPGGSPKGTVLLVHGLKDHGGRYDQLAAELGSHGYAVYAPDLRGHGRSGGDRQWVGAFTDYTADLETAWQSVGRRLDTGPVFVFGHSLGGAIVARWLVDYRPTVAGVVLSAPALQAPPTVSRGAIWITRLLGRLSPRARIFRLPFADFSRSPEGEREMAEDPLIDPRPVPARTAAELLRSMEFVRKALVGWDLPMLLLHGTGDLITDPRGSEGLKTRNPSSSLRLRLYEGLYHDLWHEPEREVVIGDLLQWLGEQATRGPAPPESRGSPSAPAATPPARDGPPGSK